MRGRYHDIYFLIETLKVIIGNILSAVFLVSTFDLRCVCVDFFKFILFAELESVGACLLPDWRYFQTSLLF